MARGFTALFLKPRPLEATLMMQPRLRAHYRQSGLLWVMKKDTPSHGDGEGDLFELPLGGRLPNGLRTR